MTQTGTEAVVDDVRAWTPGRRGPVAPFQASEPEIKADELPILEVRGGRGRFSRRTLHELWIYREVLMAFAIRAVKVKYKQAAIGIGWVVIQPVITAVLFAVTIGKLAKVPSEGAPYLLFALAGMVAWTFFSAAGSTSMASLVEDNAILRKVYFPRDILPLGAVLAGLVDLIPGLTILAVAAALYGRFPTIAWLALPLPVIVLAIAVGALGLALSGLNVYYRDVRYALPFVMSLGMFACPVIYSLSLIPEPARSVYAVMNPVAAAIDAFRKIIVHGQWPNFAYTFGALAFSLLLLVIGYSIFKRLERGFADRI